MAAVKTNVINGLTAFNNGIHNQSSIYVNFGHGFVDPLTGVLLWVGVLAVLWRRARSLEDLLAITGFLTLFFVLSFVVTKAPSYTRMLLFLPFTTYLVMQGLVAAGQGSAWLAGRSRSADLARLQRWGMAAVVGFVAIMNLTIYGAYVIGGIKNGHGVGATVRYVEARQGETPYAYYFVTGPHDIYDADGQDWRWWEYNFRQFAGAGQTMRLVPPEQTPSFDFQVPATLFMNNELWQEFGNGLRSRYPRPGISKVYESSCRRRTGPIA